MGSLALNSSPQQLQQELYRLRGELAEKNEEIESLRAQLLEAKPALQSQARLRQILSPLYIALQQVFGELRSSENIPVSPVGAQGANPKWEYWKQKLGGKAAEFITELLIHGEMTGRQLIVATRCSDRTMYKTISELNKAQLLNKNGGKFSLKEI
jgi:hypothetical protein